MHQNDMVILNMHAPNKRAIKYVKQYVKEIVFHDQVAFIPGMQGWFNI